jgi:hypothetical protein
MNFNYQIFNELYKFQMYTFYTLDVHTSARPGGGRISGTTSIFMKMGIYHKEILDDPYYYYENFEKDINGKTLGSGAFADVYIVRHRKSSIVVLDSN